MAYEITHDGEANFIGIKREGENGDWVARIQFNGQINIKAQEILIRHMVYGLEQKLYWTFVYDDTEPDFGSKYNTRADCIQAAEDWFDAKIMSEEEDMRNGESFDDVVKLVEFRINADDNCEVVASEEYTVEYVHYHGDAAEHSTY